MKKSKLIEILKDLPEDTQIMVDNYIVDFCIYSEEDESLNFQSQSEKYMEFDENGNLILWLKDKDKIVFDEIISDD